MKIDRRRAALLSVPVVVLVALTCWIVFLRPKQLNILLVTFDTTRADHIGSYGDRQALTPTLDGLAGRGVLFERAYAPAPLTLPSHATMLTGLYPPEHGLHLNGVNSLDPSIAILTEALSRQGYSTAAFIAAFVLNSQFGLNRGFDVYNDDLSRADEIDDHQQPRRSAQQIVDAALGWLRRRPKAPFFCWLHLYDPHFPYSAHAETFGKQFQDRPYDAGISYADLQLKRIIDYLEQEKLDENTLIVVVGDHGESLGEHGERTHSYMVYNATMLVPLIICDPRSSATGTRVATSVSLVDLYPTILECVGGRLSAPVSGRSLKPALQGEPLPPVNCYGESDEPAYVGGWSPLRCLMNDRWKYIRSARRELYDLTKDPHESRNLFDSQPEQASALDDALSAMEREMAQHRAPAARLSAADQRSLASLGYVAGQAPNSGRTPGTPLRDIKDVISGMYLAEDGADMIQHGAMKPAIAALQQALAIIPDNVRAQRNMGICLASTGDLAEAEKHYAAALKLDPTSDLTLINMGLLRMRQKQPDRAAAHFEQAVKLNPDSADGHFHWAEALAMLGKKDEAQQHSAEAERLRPGISAAKNRKN